MKKVQFSQEKDLFFLELQIQVKDYLAHSKHTQFGNWKIYLKTIFFLSLAVVNYVLILKTSPGWFHYGLWGIQGFLFACIGFNVMHDGAHGSFSETKTWNTFAGYTLNLMGCSVFHWKVKHNFFHHTYTNINEHDDDIYILPIIRTNLDQPVKSFHRYQHIYGPLAYMLTYVLWVWFQDFEKYFTRKVGVQKIPSHSKMKISDHVIFWITKIMHAVLFFVFPIMVHGFVSTLVGYVIFVAVCGLFIAIIFQLAHVVSGVLFETISENNSQLESFGKHQLATTADFSVDSKVAEFLFGGLNYQVEHHLFPRISHVHYPAIQKIVEKTAKEFGLEYHSFPTIWKAIQEHFLYLKFVGNAP